MRLDSVSDIKVLPKQDSILLSQNGGVSNNQQEVQANNNSSIYDKRLNDLIEQGNKVLHRLDTRLKWSVHEQSHQLIVKVLNTETNEVLREIPPEKYLDLVQNLCEQVGLFLDEKK